jgi:hypothetical protein
MDLTPKKLIIRRPNEQMLERLIRLEASARQSQQYQDDCTDVRDQVNGWLTVTENYQRVIAQSQGFDDEMSCDIVCNMMRRAHILYPDNQIFKTVPVQVRNNKASQGMLEAGCAVPSVSLHCMDGSCINLSDLIDPTHTTIVLAGSQT